MEDVKKILEESRSCIVELCTVMNVPLPSDTIRRIDRVLSRQENISAIPPAQDELLSGFCQWYRSKNGYAPYHPRGSEGAEAFAAGAEWQRNRPAQTDQQPVAVPESWWQLIHDTLRNYRMGTMDDGFGDGYPLIDAMTADGQPVSGGIQECTYLADEIWNALRVAPIAQTTQEK